MRLRIVDEGFGWQVIDEDTGERIEDVEKVEISLDKNRVVAHISLLNPKVDIKVGE